MAEDARAHGDVYGLLTTLFREEPTQAILGQMKTPTFGALMSELGIDLGEDFANGSEAALAEELAVEYARLFLGPGSHISPHESVHHHGDGGDWGSLWGSETVKVKRFIESVGVEYASDYAGIPDHISVELEFLQKLAHAEADALAKKDWERARQALTLEQRFIDEHLTQWVPFFCDKVMDSAKLPFYREMAGLLKGFLDYDSERVKVNLARAQALSPSAPAD
jgi:TorA maturation chaperone TorD